MTRMKSVLTVVALLGSTAVLTACDAVQESLGRNRGMASEVVSTSTLPTFDPSNPVSAFPVNTLDPSGDVARYSLGSVYTLGGQTVTPTEDLSYLREGIAVMGSELFSGTTASDERYNPGLYTAGHRTLPFSTIIKVTNRDNERSTLMRVNDRGPENFTHLLEVTPAAAKVLGFGNSAVANVSVEVVETVTRNVAQVTGGVIGGKLEPAAPTNAVANGTPQFTPANPVIPPGASTIATPQAIAAQSVSDPFAGNPQVPVVPTVGGNALPGASNAFFNGGGTQFFIQAGAYGERANALSMQQMLSQAGSVVIQPAVLNGRQIWRVRVGPYASETDARVALGRVVAAGAADAQVVID
jgi:rare lipoprotein A